MGTSHQAKGRNMINAFDTVKWITKGYFVGTLAMSASHMITAAHMSGLTGVEALSVPLLVDGVAALGMTMRGKAFSSRTQRDGMWVQGGAAAVSAVINVYAAQGVWGGVVLGLLLPALYMAAEALTGRLESAATEEAAKAAQKRSQAASKAAATRRARKAEQDKITKAPNVKKLRQA